MPSILITGSNRGIGLALTAAFLKADYNVIATCRQPERAEALHALKKTGQLDILPLDVSSDSSVQTLLASLGERSLDILINNAGVMGGEHQQLGDVDYDDWLQTLNINALAPFRISSALLPLLRRAQRPRVITVSSQMGAMSWQGGGGIAYQSAKAATNKVMCFLAQELAEEGIIVCPVHPGWVRTDMGGSGADISPDESAAGLLTLIESLQTEHSGRFWTWDGKEHKW